MKRYFKFKLKMINLNLKWVYPMLTLLCIAPAYSQHEVSPCELDGKLFYNDCIQYKGDCEHNQANGWGHLYLNNGNVITAFFKDNKIQNYHMQYYDAKSKYDYFVPNKGSSFAGPYVSIDKSNFVSFNENGFQIAEPEFSSTRAFCDADLYGSITLIPNTHNVIYVSAREFNSSGDRKYWVSVVDLITNKVVRKFGSFEKPLTLDFAPEFIGFTKINIPVFKASGKYYQYNIATGVSTVLLTSPSDITAIVEEVDAKKKTTYKDYSGRDKLITLADSSYIKVFNNTIYYESSNAFGSGSSLVRFSKSHEILSNLDLPSANIFDFAVDEFSNRIALSYRSKDSTYLSYLDLNSLQMKSNVFTKGNTAFDEYLRPYDKYPGTVEFSKTGIYLLYKRGNRGTTLYLGNSLYYGFTGQLYGLSNDDNVIVAATSYGSGIAAYDLEKKTIIWKTKDDGESYSGSFFKIQDTFYIVSGMVMSGVNGIKLRSLVMPKPLFSLTEFVRQPVPETPEVSHEHETASGTDNTSSQSASSQVLSPEEELLKRYMALLFLNAMLESSNKYSGSTGSTTTVKSGSSGSTIAQMKPCPECNKEFKFKVWKGGVHSSGNCWGGWENEAKSNPGYVKCGSCEGYGLNWKLVDGCPVSSSCYVDICNGGWRQCSRCSGKGQVK